MKIHEFADRLTSYYLCLLLLLFPVTSVIVFSSLPASVPSYLLVIAFAPVMLVLSMLSCKKMFYEACVFALVFLLINCVSELNVWFSHTTLSPDLKLVDKANPEKLFLRKTLFTQSIYLFTAILFYLYLKYWAKAYHINWLFWGLRLLVFYGFFEVILFQFTGKNGDIISNRMFNNVPGSGSLFQSITIEGFRMQRLKSLTGEPSMFAFTIVPFWIMAIGLKRWLDAILFFAALILSFSTSAYLGMLVLMLGLIVLYFKQQRKLPVWLLIIPFLLIAGYIFIPFLKTLFNNLVLLKLTGGNESGIFRMQYFSANIHYWWNDLNLLGKCFGIGFGTVRSTDFFSTLLVNNGILGLLIFTWFYFHHAFLVFKEKRFKYFYTIALIATYLIMMVSVPEFAYLSLWALLALPYLRYEV